MTTTDPVWDIAWDWVIRQHEDALPASCSTELSRWLAADPHHQQAYDDACQLWAATALMNCPPE